ncbi:Conserved DNA-binding protein YbaB [Amycolatopsis arida]|uniref:Conserved DNA-binding protein YbaB n=1 Tax=Amycolatopsis arida TaxID=587909 RepID=A0A1I5UUH6_9PSEU|nr:YbaB/EbfC family nucleoid-associated protein [Amycolatopsis arida]TDX91040.1 DNA-binding protein YbaB [Amycolatopsis arida]SFP98964.1 Conserved DNA-binding protein YbaB [Amycolatopsis arida]
MATEGMAGGQQWLADYTRRVGEIQRKAEQTQEQIKNLRARAASQDGSVSVVLAPGGRLERLDLSPRAMDLGPQRLATVITQTIQAAHANAAAQTEEALRPLVGESDAMEFLRDQIGTSLAEEPEPEPGTAPGDQPAGPVLRRPDEQAPSRPAPPRRPRPPRNDDDDDEPFGGSILR